MTRSLLKKKPAPLPLLRRQQQRPQKQPLQQRQQPQVLQMEPKNDLIASGRVPNLRFQRKKIVDFFFIFVSPLRADAGMFAQSVSKMFVKITQKRP